MSAFLNSYRAEFLTSETSQLVKFLSTGRFYYNKTTLIINTVGKLDIGQIMWHLPGSCATAADLQQARTSEAAPDRTRLTCRTKRKPSNKSSTRRLYTYVSGHHRQVTSEPLDLRCFPIEVTLTRVYAALNIRTIVTRATFSNDMSRNE